MIRSPALLAALCAASCVMTGEEHARPTPQRPRFSTNTRTTAAGTLELESGVAIDPGDAFSIPVRVKSGLDAATEAYAELVAYQGVEIGDDREHGIGDLLVGWRRRIQEETDRWPAALVQLEAKIPTADHERGLGTGETDLFLGGAGEKDVDGTRVTGFYQLGLLGETSGGGLELQHGFAVVGTRPLDDRFEAFGEAAFVWTPEQSDEQVFTTLGLNFLATPALVFDVAFQLGLSSDAPDFLLLFGLTPNLGRVLWPRAVQPPE